MKGGSPEDRNTPTPSQTPAPAPTPPEPQAFPQASPRQPPPLAVPGPSSLPQRRAIHPPRGVSQEPWMRPSSGSGGSTYSDTERVSEEVVLDTLKSVGYLTVVQNGPIQKLPHGHKVSP